MYVRLQHLIRSQCRHVRAERWCCVTGSKLSNSQEIGHLKECTYELFLTADEYFSEFFTQNCATETKGNWIVQWRVQRLNCLLFRSS